MSILTSYTLAVRPLVRHPMVWSVLLQVIWVGKPWLPVEMDNLPKKDAQKARKEERLSDRACLIWQSTTRVMSHGASGVIVEDGHLVVSKTFP